MTSSSNQDNELERGLREAERARGDSYDKRTEHLNPDGTGRFINRLILEDSPYLLQHAHNPVNWYPWGDEAFATAQVENKPVFLSIGYSTCHWCHVMEVESFDNVEIATVLNQHFISIKMDREQFPDIDEIYMTGVQIMSGQGGWPMSNFLLPDGRPFFGATYFPPPTFLKLLQQIASAWQQKYEELAHSAASIDAAIKRVLEDQQAAASLDTGVSEQCVTALLKHADQRFGGLAGAPKFPQEPLLLFTLEQAWRELNPEALNFVETALEKMGQGGIYDQVGGGFHRYSVDEHWLVPHFEKMLYNQSQLGMVYLQAWRLTGKAAFRRILTQTLDYVLRDMQAPDGGFYSATDADSEGAEGTFFLWTPEQLKQVLEADEAALIEQLYNVSDSGNFEGGNILNLDHSLETLAESRRDPGLIEKVQQALAKLYQAREQRVHPLRDNKLIVAWNGAMITTLTWAAYYLERDDWLAAARRAAQTLWESNFPGDGELRRIRLADTVSIAGQLEDFAHLAEAFISLFDVTGDDAYLHKAAQLMQACETRFRDAGQGRLFLSPAQSQGPQLARSTNAADSATLSPVATALFCWQRLRERAARLPDSDALHLQHLVDQSFPRLYGAINDQPLSHTSLLRLQAQRLWGPLDAIHYGSEGRAKLILQARQAGNGTLDLEITVQLAPDWHILSPDSGSRYQALTLDFTEPETAARQGWQIADFDSPEPGDVVALPDGETIPAFTDKLHLRATLKRASGEPQSPAPGISLSLQLCDHGRCLLPEKVNLLLPAV